MAAPALTSTVALVTGANLGIGYEIVKKLAATYDDKVHILLGSRSLDKGQQAYKDLRSPSNVSVLQLDVTDDASIDRAYNDIESRFGKLDVLIHNAGSGGAEFPPGTTLREKWDKVHSINVTSPALITEKYATLLDKSSSARVIFMSSTLGSISIVAQGWDPVPVPWYSSTKSALNYLTAYYARKHPEWKVNACCPGLRSTRLGGAPLSPETDPALGATNAIRLMFDESGATATFTNDEGTVLW